jgi:A/G-specific adenine glycosylase
MKDLHAMLGPNARQLFRRRLLGWFDRNRRELAWRADRDPYHVWLSEVMLQQTRVAVVRERYPAFLARFTNVQKLAAARVSQVLAAWSGLGYYRRARALHAAAKEIVERGRFPATARDLASLPGIGRYTAAAIASIAFDEHCAVVDGNVERVLRRLFGLCNGDAWRLAQQLLSPHRPGDFNQAMMELGATVCLPKTPSCAECPVVTWCRTRGSVPSRIFSRRRKKFIGYLLSIRDESVLLVRRAKHESIMPDMWELPQARAGVSNPVMRFRHAITSTNYDVAVYRRTATKAKGRWVKLRNVQRLPLTGLTQKILRHSKLI